MWLLLALLAVGVVLGFLVRLATRPIRTLVNTVRVLLFLLGLLLLVLYFLVGSEIPAESRQELIPYIVAVFGAWLLTFLIPGAIALLVRSRDRE